MPGAKPPVALPLRGKQVCTCFNITESDIAAQLGQRKGNEDQRLVQLQGALKCGTNCGSCLPQVKRMVRMSIPSSQRDATLQ